MVLILVLMLSRPLLKVAVSRYESLSGKGCPPPNKTDGRGNPSCPSVLLVVLVLVLLVVIVTVSKKPRPWQGRRLRFRIPSLCFLEERRTRLTFLLVPPLPPPPLLSPPLVDCLVGSARHRQAAAGDPPKPLAESAPTERRGTDARGRRWPGCREGAGTAWKRGGCLQRN